MKQFLLWVLFCIATILGRLEGMDLPKGAYFPKEDLRPGMRGVTFTVLQGNRVEALQTEVLGVAKNWVGPGLDLIIARLVDPKTALTGAVHGMSGSPLFIDGRIVGALSRRIATFEKDGHCGFTPFEDMWKVGAALPQKPSEGFLSDLTRRFWRQPISQLFRRQEDRFLGIPLSVPGLSPSVSQKILAKWGLDGGTLLPVASGGRGKLFAGADATNLEVGAPLAAVMMTGDIQIAGTGTLTWREGSRVLGFGHPMFGFGPSAIPMATAEVITTVPSYLLPYKVTNTGPIVGTITEDRLSAIGGAIGPVPRLATYQFRRVHEGIPLSTLRGALVVHPVLSPLLLELAIASVLEDTDALARTFTIEVSGEVHFRDLPPLRLQGLYSGQDGDLAGTVLAISRPLEIFFSQGWTEPLVENVDLSFVSKEKEEVWNLESVVAESSWCEPGSTLPVLLRLQKRYGPRIERRLEIPIPSAVPPGNLELRVLSGSALDRHLLDRTLPGLQRPEELIEQLNRRHRSDAFYVELVGASEGLVSAGVELPALPPSVRAVAQGAESPQKEALNEVVWAEEAVEVPGVAVGEASLSLAVR
jgi:hypothetical protein